MPGLKTSSLSDVHTTAQVHWFERLVAALLRWTKRLVILAAVVAVVGFLITGLVSLITNHLWFESVDESKVYSTMLGAKILLFCVFAVPAGLVSGLTLRAVHRIRPRFEVTEKEQTVRWWFREHDRGLWPWLLTAAIAVPAYVVGSHAASQWQTYLLWRHATPWGQADPRFGKDLSFFVEVLPFHRLVVALLTQAVVLALVVLVVSGAAYGTWKLRGPGPRVTRRTTVLLSGLLAAYLVLKAIGYWLARYAVDTSQRGPVTGASYTDVHAWQPGRVLLMLVALAAAVLLIVNVIALRRLRLVAGALVLTLAASLVLGSWWPTLVRKLREQPSAAKVDLGEIAANQKATRAAFGLGDNVTSVSYDPQKALTGDALQSQADNTAQIQLVDPNKMAPTFNVKQELQAYYHFKSTLDVDHYDLDGKDRDLALAVRELSVGGVPQRNWVNTHLVYTHGYGAVAAPTDTIDPTTQSPTFLNGGMPPAQDIAITQPDVYFGQTSPSYSIVGQPKGSHQNLEFDHPAPGGGAGAAHTTYTGGGGIPIGSTLRRLLFAVSLKSPNVLFSSEVNSGSQLLTVRNPRARVAKVAPWLTLDGDVYPALVGGRIEWVVDGYTSSSAYPYSSEVNLRAATHSSLSSGSTVNQPSRQVNYLRNSVKAVVDAYTGKVTLYQWDENQAKDPLLTTWEKVFPGLVKPQSSIPAALLPHLRYPRDLFSVQRMLLAKYHVTDASDFYSGNDFWRVPSDPTVAANKQINSSSTGVIHAAPAQPATYMSLSPDGYGAQTYSLSSPMVNLNRRELAAYVSVDSEPGPDYGKFTVLTYGGGDGGESPAQVQNDIESSTQISEALTLQRGGNSKVVLGNLQAIPLAGKMLYVEPVYTQAAGQTSFPILRHVIVLYANGDPAFDDNLPAALKTALKSAQDSGQKTGQRSGAKG